MPRLVCTNCICINEEKIIFDECSAGLSPLIIVDLLLRINSDDLCWNYISTDLSVRLIEPL